MEIKLTTKEKTILSCIDKKYRYIARDKDGSLFLYEYKPDREEVPSRCAYQWTPRGHFEWHDFRVFNHLFTFIKWEDKEPYLIEYLLKGK